MRDGVFDSMVIKTILFSIRALRMVDEPSGPSVRMVGRMTAFRAVAPDDSRTLVDFRTLVEFRTLGRILAMAKLPPNEESDHKPRNKRRYQPRPERDGDDRARGVPRKGGRPLDDDEGVDDDWELYDEDDLEDELEDDLDDDDLADAEDDADVDDRKPDRSVADEDDGR
jgi:hypothetical protein